MKTATSSHSAAAVLLSPGFLVGLLTLVLNDLLLKEAVPGVITGKLSDFTGLFVFTMFFAALVPRWTSGVYWLTGVSFIGWKLPLSQPLINLWNTFGVFPVTRVVDLSDLFALSVLPVSLWYFSRVHLTPCSRAGLASVVALVSLLAFAGTSRGTMYFPYKDYSFNLPEQEIAEQLHILAHVGYHSPKSDIYSLSLPSDICSNSFVATVILEPKEGGTCLRLQTLRHGCVHKEQDREKMLDVRRHR